MRLYSALYGLDQIRSLNQPGGTNFAKSASVFTILFVLSLVLIFIFLLASTILFCLPIETVIASYICTFQNPLVLCAAMFVITCFRCFADGDVKCTST